MDRPPSYDSVASPGLAKGLSPATCQLNIVSLIIDIGIDADGATGPGASSTGSLAAPAPSLAAASYPVAAAAVSVFNQPSYRRKFA